MMFPHTVTVYNQADERWHRTVLEGVLWASTVGAVLRKTGVAPQDGVQLIIPRSKPGYVKPKAWESLSSKSGSWTLRGGDKVVLGVHGDVLGTKDFASVDDVITITTADDYAFGSLACFEVMGK